jgi:hypothetical protein
LKFLSEQELEELDQLTKSSKSRYTPGGWKEWAKARCSLILSGDSAPHHELAWQWAESLQPGIAPPAFIAAWNRGAGKSAVFQAMCCRWADTLQRRFVLMINETQDQSDKSVQAVAEQLEANGIEVARNPLGAPRGWRQNMIRTADGFNLLGIGWATAIRGVRMGALRPDVIFIEDVDDRLDTPALTEKKKTIITQTFLAAGAPGMAVAFGQNVILSGGLMQAQVEGTADFLTNRTVSLVRAVDGLEIGYRDNENGTRTPFIESGTSTWPSRLTAEVLNSQLEQMGVRAFLREFQHLVSEQGGGLWDNLPFRYIADCLQEGSFPVPVKADGLPYFDKIVVSVDPSGSRRGDEAGIVAVSYTHLTLPTM